MLLHELTWFVDKLHELVPIPTAHRGGVALLETPGPVQTFAIHPATISTTVTPLGIPEPYSFHHRLSVRRVIFVTGMPIWSRVSDGYEKTIFVESLPGQLQT